MAAYISVPRDLTRVKSKILFGLTKRQIVCFGTGALIGVPVYFFVRVAGNLSLAVLAMIVVMLPFFFFGLYERNGQPPEVVARHFYQARFVRPKVRPYQTNNYYAALLRQADAQEEVTRIVQKAQQRKAHRTAKRDDGIPRTAQQTIPFERMFADGTCRVRDGYYTRTIQFQDINYQLSQQEDKTAIFEEWCSFLNFFDSSVRFELSFMNTATDAEDFERNIKVPPRKDGFDDVRVEYSQMLKTQLAQGNNGLTKTKYLTFGIEAASMRQAKPRLDHIQNDILNNFRRLGAAARVLNGEERLRLMHAMFHMDGESKFRFDWKQLPKSGLSVKDFIAPSAFAFNTRTFQVGGLYGAGSFLNITASDLSDQLLKDFLGMESSQIVTMHVHSVDQNKAIKTVKRTITELDKSKIDEQKKAVRAGYDIDILPSDLATYGQDAKNLLKELQSQNGGQHRPEAQLPAGAPGLAAGTGPHVVPAPGPQHGGDRAGADHQFHRHLYPVHDAGIVPGGAWCALLRPQRSLQQPHHGGPQATEKSQRPDFGYAWKRKIFRSQAGNHQRISLHG